MDLNRFSYYRANPFASNDFIPLASMANRTKKQFPSQIPQGQQHIASKPGKRIFRDKVQQNQIQKDNILQSPQKYPFQNRIALDKSYNRNLDTIDIQGATAGTKISQSIRNKHKALEQLRRRNNQQIKSPLLGESLDQVYQKKRRQMAEQIQKNIQMRKTKQSLAMNGNSNNNQDQLQNNRNDQNNPNNNSHQSTKLGQKQLQTEYQRYVAHNSNKKYNGSVGKSYEYEGFQRYRRPQGSFQTLDSYNNGRIPESIAIDRNGRYEYGNRHSSIDRAGGVNSENNLRQMNNDYNNQRRNSVDIMNQDTSPPNNAYLPSTSTGRQSPSSSSSYMNNGSININNRHRSNPQYIQKFPNQLEKRASQLQKTRQMQQSIRSTYKNDRAQMRRHNPTNLSFNIAARSSLMGPIL